MLHPVINNTESSQFYTLTCNFHDKNLFELKFNPIVNCLVDPTILKLSEEFRAEKLDRNDIIMTGIKAEFSVNIPCNLNDNNRINTKFENIFAGVILPLQAQSSNNYRNFYVENVICNSTSSIYEITVEFHEINEKPLSYPEKAVIANQYLSIFRNYIIENNLNQVLAKDLGGTKSKFTVNSIEISQFGSDEEEKTVISPKILEAKTLLQEMLLENIPIFDDNGETDRSFTEVMRNTAVNVQDIFDNNFDFDVDEDDVSSSSLEDIQAKIDLANNFMESMTNTFDEWTRSTPELNSTDDALLSAIKLTNNVIFIINETQEQLRRLNLKNSETTLVNSDIAVAFLQSVEDIGIKVYRLSGITAVYENSKIQKN